MTVYLYSVIVDNILKDSLRQFYLSGVSDLNNSVSDWGVTVVLQTDDGYFSG
jgi:hypothetical protein